jgi:hypothetical protein
MSLICKSEEILEIEVQETPLYTLDSSYLTFEIDQEKIVFNVSTISNLRCLKKRDFSANIALLFCIIAAYCFVTDYFTITFPNNLLLVLTTIVSSVVLISIRRYTYVLFVNTKDLRYRKLKIHKKDIFFALHLVGLFKSGYLQKI